jgi:hypothetical protein
MEFNIHKINKDLYIPKWEITPYRELQTFKPYQKLLIKDATWKPIHLIGIFICQYYQKDYYLDEAKIYYIHKKYAIRTPFDEKIKRDTHKNLNADWNFYFYPIFVKYDLKKFYLSLYFQLKVFFSIDKKTKKIIITDVKFYKYIDPISTSIF